MYFVSSRRPSEISPTNNVANTKSATAAPSDAAMQEVFAAVINRAKQEEENVSVADTLGLIEIRAHS
jgi:hypothetical protein